MGFWEWVVSHRNFAGVSFRGVDHEVVKREEKRFPLKRLVEGYSPEKSNI